MFDLQTLGRVELRNSDGERVRGLQTRPKDLALLTYLAAAGPFGFQRRDTLLALLWPDLDAAHGRNALSQSLHRLRASLASGVLVTEGRAHVGLSAQHLSCDAVTFERDLESGSLLRALRSYAGDFLAGFHASGVAPEFDDWIVTERERLQRQAFNAMRLLAEVEEESENYGAAIEWLQRAAEVRPFDETLCRRMIAALARAGNRSGALAIYARFARQLADEYGCSPSVETRACAAALRSMQAATSGFEPLRRSQTDSTLLEAFLKGRYFSSTMVQTARGLEFLEEAIALDQTYAPAHAARAMATANLALLGHLRPYDARAAIEESAQTALELDPGFGDAYTALATARMMFDWDWDAAACEFRTALSCNPNSSDAHSYFALFLCAIERADQGVAEARLAQQLDPLGLWANFILGWALFRARRYGESIHQLRSVLELYPHFAFAHLFLAENHLQEEACVDAVEACRTALRLLPEDQLLLGLSACVVGLSGEQELAHTLSGKLETLKHSRYVCPGHLAAAHLGLHNYDQAFEYWGTMCRDRSPLACLVPTDPLYDCVRQDRRFVEMARSMNLPSSAASAPSRVIQRTISRG